jgi:hypothetical protein
MMSLYQCILLKSGETLRTGETIDSASLQGAVLQGRRIIAHRPHYDAFEIWEEARLLHCESRSDAPLQLRSPVPLRVAHASRPAETARSHRRSRG